MEMKKAFTLVELLVVISIIALLMAIIMPALNRVRLSTYEVICRSNLKQYGLAGMMYVENNDSIFPNAWDSIYKSRGQWRNCQWHDEERNPENHKEYQGALWRYLGGGNKVHYCRTFAKFVKSSEPHVGHNPSIPIVPLFCYSMNGFLGGFESYNTKKMKISSNQIRRPDRVFFFAEENGWPYTPIQSDSFYPYGRYKDTLNDNALCGARKLPDNPLAWNMPLDTPPPFLDSFGSFHKTTFKRKNEGMANASFVDGHVQLVDPDKTYYYSKPMDIKTPPIERVN